MMAKFLSIVRLAVLLSAPMLMQPTTALKTTKQSPFQTVDLSAYALAGGGCASVAAQSGFLRGMLEVGAMSRNGTGPRYVGTVAGGGWLLASYMFGDFADEAAALGKVCEDLTEECMTETSQIGVLQSCHALHQPGGFAAGKAPEGEIADWTKEQLHGPALQEILQGHQPLLYQVLPSLWYNLVDEKILKPVGIDGSRPFRDFLGSSDDKVWKRWQTTVWAPAYTLPSHHGDALPALHGLGPYPSSNWRVEENSTGLKVQDMDPWYYDVPLKRILGVSSNMLSGMVSHLPPWLLTYDLPTDPSQPIMSTVSNFMTEAFVQAIGRATISGNTGWMPFALPQTSTDSNSHHEFSDHAAMNGCTFDNTGIIATAQAIDRAFASDGEAAVPYLLFSLNTADKVEVPLRYFFGEESATFSCSGADEATSLFSRLKKPIFEPACEGPPKHTKKGDVDTFFHMMQQEGIGFMKIGVKQNDVFNLRGGWAISLFVIDMSFKSRSQKFISMLPKDSVQRSVAEAQEKMSGGFPASSFDGTMFGGDDILNGLLSQYTTWLTMDAVQFLYERMPLGACGVGPWISVHGCARVEMPEAPNCSSSDAIVF